MNPMLCVSGDDSTLTRKAYLSVFFICGLNHYAQPELNFAIKFWF